MWYFFALIGVIFAASAATLAHAYSNRRLAGLRGVCECQLTRDYIDTRFLTGLKSPGAFAVDSLPGYFIALLLLQEDDRFFLHQGYHHPENWIRHATKIVRMAPRTLGRSLSQQLVKNTVYSEDNGWFLSRLFSKSGVALTAVRLERMFDKHEILQLYLMSTLFGGQEELGISNACTRYFDCEPHQLTFAQSLFLIGLIPSPYITMQKMKRPGVQSVFPFGAAFANTVDLMRLYVRTWGVAALNDPSRIRYEDVFLRFTNFDRQQPESLPQELECDLEMRAFQVVTDLRAVVTSVVARLETEQKST